jgi:hypothetical protein
MIKGRPYRFRKAVRRAELGPLKLMTAVFAADCAGAGSIRGSLRTWINIMTCVVFGFALGAVSGGS